MDFLKRAAAGGSLKAMAQLRNLMWSGTDDDNAPRRQEIKSLVAQWWPGIKKRIDASDPEAMFTAFGMFRWVIEGVTEADEIQWLERAAAQGHREGLYVLGQEMEYASKYNRALDYYEEAAEKGHWRAALAGAWLAAYQKCDLDGDAGDNPEAAAAKADELAKLAENNAGCMNDEIEDYWGWRFGAGQEEADSPETEEDGTPLESGAPETLTKAEQPNAGKAAGAKLPKQPKDGAKTGKTEVKRLNSK
jgi:hypothetical protein